jgi:hypothetical protein
LHLLLANVVLAPGLLGHPCRDSTDQVLFLPPSVGLDSVVGLCCVRSSMRDFFRLLPGVCLTRLGPRLKLKG